MRLKSICQKIVKAVKHPILIVDYLEYLGLFNKLSDEQYIRTIYRIRFGKRINLENPKTFNEKLQWLKLYERNPMYTQMVDKAGAKEYVSEKMGASYIIPTLGVWDHFEDIDFDKLPNKFVLKCTHDSGGLVICKDKAALDMEAVKEKINQSLHRRYYLHGREWPYKDVKPRIIAEEYLDVLGKKELVEYKIFCFNGEAKMVLVCKGEAHSGLRTNDFCDRQLNRFPFKSLNPCSEGKLEVPAQLQEMLDFAEELAGDIPQVRIDLYLVEGKIYFGEMTFFHNSGFCKFDPPEWDEKVGSWITLPKRGD